MLATALFVCLALFSCAVPVLGHRDVINTAMGIKVVTDTHAADNKFGIYVDTVSGGTERNVGIYTASRVVTPASFHVKLPLLTEDDADWEAGDRDVDSYHALKALAKLKMHRHNKTQRLLPRRSSLREMLPSAYDPAEASLDLTELLSTLVLAVRHLAYETQTERNCRIQNCGVNVCHGNVCGLGCPEPCTRFQVDDDDQWTAVPPDGELSARKPPTDVDHAQQAAKDRKEWLRAMESQRKRAETADRAREEDQVAAQTPEEKPWEAVRMSREDYEKLSESEKESKQSYAKFNKMIEKLKHNGAAEPTPGDSSHFPPWAVPFGGGGGGMSREQFLETLRAHPDFVGRAAKPKEDK